MEGGEIREKNIGSVAYKKIWEEIGIGEYVKGVRRERKMRYEIEEAVFLMSVSRLIEAVSKNKLMEKKEEYVFKSGIKLEELYKALEVVSQGKEEIIKKINESIGEKYKREIEVVLYDVTTYHFESVKEDEIKDFGYSKACKFNEVQVVMGLFIDENGIPMGYEIFRGNTFDSKTLKESLKRLGGGWKGKEIIVVADRGINSKENLKMIREKGYDYVVGSKIRGAKGEIKEEILKGEGYREVYDKERGEIKYKVKEIDDIKEEGSRLIVTWSKERAEKDRQDRERLIEKAIKLVEEPGKLRASNKRGGKKYIGIETQGEEIKIDEEKIREDEKYDGYYAIETSKKDISEQEVIRIQHQLWKIEESFRVLKQQIKARPIYHWTPTRIRGHFVVCYIALVLERVLEYKIKLSGNKISPQKIQETLRGAKVTVLGKRKDSIYLKQESSRELKTIMEVVGMKEMETGMLENEFRNWLSTAGMRA